MKLLPLTPETEPFFVKELAQSLFDVESKDIKNLSSEQLVCIQELLGNQPPRLIDDPLKDLARQLLWMLYKARKEGVTWSALAERAFLERTIFWSLRTKIIDLWKGKEMPLFSWGIVHSIAFAAINNHPTPKFISWWRTLRTLYEDAFAEYGSASKKIPAIKIEQLSPVRQKELARTK